MITTRIKQVFTFSGFSIQIQEPIDNGETAVILSEGNNPGEVILPSPEYEAGYPTLGDMARQARGVINLCKQFGGISQLAMEREGGPSHFAYEQTYNRVVIALMYQGIGGEIKLDVGELDQFIEMWNTHIERYFPSHHHHHRWHIFKKEIQCDGGISISVEILFDGEDYQPKGVKTVGGHPIPLYDKVVVHINKGEEGISFDETWVGQALSTEEILQFCEALNIITPYMSQSSPRRLPEVEVDFRREESRKKILLTIGEDNKLHIRLNSEQDYMTLHSSAEVSLLVECLLKALSSAEKFGIGTLLKDGWEVSI